MKKLLILLLLLPCLAQAGSLRKITGRSEADDRRSTNINFEKIENDLRNTVKKTSTQTITGAKFFDGNAYFKGTNPWHDVMNYGALGDCSTDDHDAIVAAIAASQTDGGPVRFPTPPGGCYKTSQIDLSSYVQLYLVGSHSKNSSGLLTGGIVPQVRIDGTGIASGPVFLIDRGGSVANMVFENLAITGKDTAITMRDTANVYFDNVSFKCQDTASTDNASIVMENCFWMYFYRCGMSAPSATEYNIIMRGKSPAPNVKTCYLIFFDHIIPNVGGMVKYEQTTSMAGTTSGDIVFNDVVSENFSLPILTISSSPESSSTFIRYRFSSVQHADEQVTPLPLVRQSTNAVLSNFVFENCVAPGNRAIEVTGDGNVIGTVMLGSRNMIITDGSGAPYSKGGGVRYKDFGMHITGAQSNAPTNTSATGGAGPAITVAEKGETQARFGIDAYGQQYWGPGGSGGGWDTTLYRGSSGTLTTDDYLQIRFGTAAPAAGDCAAGQEGKLFFDHSADLLYICSGASGWVSK